MRPQLVYLHDDFEIRGLLCQALGRTFLTHPTLFYNGKMNVLETNPHGKLTNDRLKAFESEIGIPLPDDYREFLLQHNGGKPDPCHFPIAEDTDSLHHVYGLHDGPTWFRLDDARQTYHGRIPASMIPIADDPYGNAICLGVTGNERGRIYFWDHENESDDEPYFDNITTLAATFSDFVDSLFKWVDPNETSLEKALNTNDLDSFKSLLDPNIDLEAKDEHGRTMIENAAIQNSAGIIRYLFDRGASLRNALQLAQQNAKFFPEHKRSVDLIKKLRKGNSK